MVTTYCNAEQVASRCQFMKADGNGRAVWGEDPKFPSLEEVEDFINEAEEWINEQCQTAWGDLFLQITAELQDLHVDYLEASVQMNFPNVMAFETGEGDKLEVWNGQIWTDWVTTKNEDRGGDFFVDYEMGKIYFLSVSDITRRDRKNIKLTYRVNRGSVIPLPVSYACSLLAGINIMNSEYATIAFPEGEGEELPIDEILRRWWRMIKNKLKPYLKSGLFTGTPFEPAHIY